MTNRTYRSGFYLVALAVEAALITIPSRAAAQNLGGAITRIDGTAEVQLVGAAQPKPVVLNMRLEYHEQLTTHDKSQVDIALPRDTKLVASQTTIVSFDRGPLGSQIKLLRGLLEVAVRPPNDTQILTGNGEIEVHGTLFDVRYTEGVVRPGYAGCEQYTDLIVREGLVAISNPANPAVVVEVPAGYETTVACKLPPLNPGPIGITGAPAPGNAATGRTSAAAAITGSAVPPAEVGPSFPFPVVDP